MSTQRAATLDRLIAIRREDIEPVKADLFRLNRLCDELEVAMNLARQIRESFLDELRFAETRQRTLNSGQMMVERRYLQHLGSLVESAEENLSDATEQRRQAQALFNVLYSEIRALERLGERRVAGLEKDQQRTEYMQQDDTEIIRSHHNRESHAAY